MENKALLTILTVLVVITALMSLGALLQSNLSSTDVTKIVKEEIALIPVPAPVPTAAEIAAAVVIPEITIPTAENADNELLNVFLKEQYQDDVDELELAAYDAVLAEFDEEDLEDFLKENIEGFDTLKDFGLSDFDDDETVISITALGLEKDEDKTADVTIEIEVKYTLEEGQVTKFKKKVALTASVLFDEGDFSDEDVELTFSL